MDTYEVYDGHFERDGVHVWLVKLSGWIDNQAAADFAQRFNARAAAQEAEVAVLDVMELARPDGDECTHVTAVLPGIPNVWVTLEQQPGGRWDLPPASRLRTSRDEAIETVVSWRRACSFRLEGAAYEWNHRGLWVNHQDDPGRDLFFRNRLIERHFDNGRKVLFARPDKRDSPTESMRRGARLVYEADGHISEVDVVAREWNNHSDWLARIADLADQVTRVRTPIPVHPHEVVTLLARFSRLQELWVSPGSFGTEAFEALLSGWAPDLTHVFGAGTLPEPWASRLAHNRPNTLFSG